jgi:hypothetical protein
VRTAALLSVAAAGLAIPSAVAIPSHSSAATTCHLYAEQPYWTNATISGQGSWSGCAASTTVTVVLRQDRPWWPDRTLASRLGTGATGARQVSYPCGLDFDPIKVFIEVRQGSNKVQSPRATLPCG